MLKAPGDHKDPFLGLESVSVHPICLYEAVAMPWLLDKAGSACICWHRTYSSGSMVLPMDGVLQCPWWVHQGQGPVPAGGADFPCMVTWIANNTGLHIGVIKLHESWDWKLVVVWRPLILSWLYSAWANAGLFQAVHSLGQIQCKGWGLERTIKITWKGNQEVGSKLLVRSVGPVGCRDLRQSTKSCCLPARNPPSQGCTRNPMVLSRAGAAGRECLHSLRIKSAVFWNAGISRGLLRESHGLSLQWQQSAVTLQLAR